MNKIDLFNFYNKQMDFLAKHNDYNSEIHKIDCTSQVEFNYNHCLSVDFMKRNDFLKDNFIAEYQSVANDILKQFESGYDVTVYDKIFLMDFYYMMSLVMNLKAVFNAIDKKKLPNDVKVHVGCTYVFTNFELQAPRGIKFNNEIQIHFEHKSQFKSFMLYSHFGQLENMMQHKGFKFKLLNNEVPFEQLINYKLVNKMFIHDVNEYAKRQGLFISYYNQDLGLYINEYDFINVLNGCGIQCLDYQKSIIEMNKIVNELLNDNFENHDITDFILENLNVNLNEFGDIKYPFGLHSIKVDKVSLTKTRDFLIHQQGLNLGLFK